MKSNQNPGSAVVVVVVVAARKNGTEAVQECARQRDPSARISGATR